MKWLASIATWSPTIGPQATRSRRKRLRQQPPLRAIRHRPALAPGLDLLALTKRGEGQRRPPHALEQVLAAVLEVGSDDASHHARVHRRNVGEQPVEHLARA